MAISYNDYYPFGMLIPERHEASGSYRYGFQGQEKDDEIKGEGNSLNYTFRMHDPRVGRFFAVDPLTSKYPWYTPYSFSGNKVIAFVELEGLEEGWVVNEQYEVVYKPGPFANTFSSKELAQRAASIKVRTPQILNETDKYAEKFKPITDKYRKNSAVIKQGLTSIEKASLDPVMYPGGPFGIGGGVAIGIKEVVSDAAIEGVFVKAGQIYSYYKKTDIAYDAIKSADNIYVCEEFIDNSEDVFEIYKTAKAKSLQNITDSKVTSLGSFPEYIEKAKDMGYSYFDIGKLWDDLVKNGQNTWEINKMFLDKIAENGDDVLITLGKNSDGTTKKIGEYLKKEIEYLTKEKGYIWKDAKKTILTKPN